MTSMSAMIRGQNDLSGLDFDEAVTAGGWDFEVEKRQAYYIPDPIEASTDTHDYSAGVNLPPAPVKGPDCNLLVRKDTGAVMGQCGRVYQVTQNSVPVEQVRPLVDDGLARIKHAGTWGGGKACWMVIQFDTERLIELARQVASSSIVPNLEALFHDERIEPWGLVKMDHSGQGSNLIVQLPFRLWCLNQLPGIMRQKGTAGGVSIRHSLSGAETMRTEAAKLFAGMAQRYALYGDEYVALRKQALTPPVFNRLVLDEALPLHVTRPNMTTRQLNSRVRVQERRSEVTRLWTEGAHHVGDDSAWEALNGLSEALDHDSDRFRSRGGAEGRLRSRLDGTMMGAKRRVHANLVRFSTDHTFRSDVFSTLGASTPSLN